VKIDGGLMFKNPANPEYVVKKRHVTAINQYRPCLDAKSRIASGLVRERFLEVSLGRAGVPVFFGGLLFIMILGGR
jgi:hypothetical protein